MVLLNQVETSQTFISQASAAYQKGDLQRASDLIWKSGYHAVKAISERRAWKFDTPGEMHSVAHKLSEETGKEDIYALFTVAFISPYNFNEGWLNDRGVAMNIEHAKQLLELLEDIE